MGASNTTTWNDTIITIKLRQRIEDKLDKINESIKRTEPSTKFCFDTKPCYVCYKHNLPTRHNRGEKLLWLMNHNLITAEKLFQQDFYQFSYNKDDFEKEYWSVKNTLNKINLNLDTEYSPIIAIILTSFAKRKKIDITCQRKMISLLRTYGFKLTDEDRRMIMLIVYDKIPKLSLFTFYQMGIQHDIKNTIVGKFMELYKIQYSLIV